MAWLSIPHGDPEALCRSIETAVQTRIKRGEFSDRDIENIRKRNLELIPKDLDLPPVLLNKLRRLCQLWEVDIRDARITSHRKIIGPLIVRAKRILFPLIRFVLKDFIREQKDFNAEVISFLSELANDSERRRKA